MRALAALTATARSGAGESGTPNLSVYSAEEVSLITALSVSATCKRVAMVSTSNCTLSIISRIRAEMCGRPNSSRLAMGTFLPLPNTSS